MSKKIILINGPFELQKGYLNGRNYPQLRVRVKSQQLQTNWSELIDNLVHRTLEHIEFLGYTVEPDAITKLHTPKASNASWTELGIPVPDCSSHLVYQCWRLALQTLQQPLDRAALLQLESLKRSSPSPLMTRAAQALGLPFFIISESTAQYGIGRNSCWFNHTFSEQTSNLAARLARDKRATVQRLRSAGLPTTQHFLVSNLNQALDAAQHLGYPVVTKPYNHDGGSGVTAAISGPKDLKNAYEKAAKLSKNVLIEKHVAGRDYRLTVFDGKLVWAVERRAAGVTGDGKQTIAQLIEQENQHPARALGSKAQTLKPLSLNQDALRMLEKQNLQATDIPKAGLFVQLHSIANVATGGTPHVVTDNVHPDNAELAERAVAALRLDLAGVDLLIEDISRSWREIGGAICEVNSQPDLGSTTARHLYQQLLATRVPHQGHIPVNLMLYSNDAKALATAAAQACVADLRKVHANVGYSLIDTDSANTTTRQNFINDLEIVHVDNTFYDVAVMFLTDRTIDALVMCASIDDILQHGLPLRSVDELRLFGDIDTGLRQALAPHAELHQR